MTREIKFRAWDKIAKVMRPMADISIRNEHLFVWSEDGNSQLHHHAIFMQYTGLKDFKGTEIYDGDVVEYYKHYSTGKAKVCWVTWEPNNCRYRASFNETDGHSLSRWDQEYLKVIGNIYENPELLTTKEND